MLLFIQNISALPGYFFHNKLTPTKFGWFTSFVQSFFYYWTIDVNHPIIEKLLHEWRQQQKPRRPCLAVSGKQDGCRKISSAEYKAYILIISKFWKYFKWPIKQLLNSAFVWYEELCRPQRVLSTSASGFGRITPSWVCIILHIILSLIQ